MKVSLSTVMVAFIVANLYKGFDVGTALMFCHPVRYLRGHGTMAPFHGWMGYVRQFSLMGPGRRVEVVDKDFCKCYVYWKIGCIYVCVRITKNIHTSFYLWHIVCVAVI